MGVVAAHMRAAAQRALGTLLGTLDATNENGASRAPSAFMQAGKFPAKSAMHAEYATAVQWHPRIRAQARGVRRPTRLGSEDVQEGGFSVARFMGKIERSDGTSFDMPAETCPHCKGIGYLTGPLTYKGRRIGEKEHQFRRAGSGDRCPLCVGKGWIGLIGKRQKP